MQVDVKKVKNALLVTVNGDMDLVMAEKLKNKLDHYMESNNCQHLLINLEQVHFIDSSGLGMILGRYKRISAKGGKVSMINPQPQVKRILELTGFEKIMTIYDSESEALLQLA